MAAPSERFFEILGEALPRGRVSRRDDDLASYGRDWTRVFEPAPSGVVFPRSTAEVSTILRLCDEQDVWVVPSGGRTGLAAGAVARQGELVLSLEKMSRIGEVDLVSGTVHVEAGAVTQAVHDACRAHGLTWPIDLAAKGSCQIGGNISTNAGGVRVIRYGSTRHWVLGIVAVKMGGEVLRLNGALEKNNTGYDLRQLVIGSEGTLAVVTEAVLKLTRAPPPGDVMLFAARDLDAVLALCRAARVAPFDVMALELFTDACLVEVEAGGRGRSPFPARAPAYALLEVSARGSDDVDRFLEGVLDSGVVLDGVRASSSAQERSLWALRENITESLGKKGLVHKNDVAVPVKELSRFSRALLELLTARYADLELFLFGHVGDGNLHVNLVKPADMAKERFLERTAAVDVDMAALLAAHGGSVSAEHGIGLIKKPLLGYTRSPAELVLFRSIKRAFDPKGLLNPGKVFD